MYYKEGGDNMAFSVRLSPAEDVLIKKYAALNNMNVSEFVRQAVLERIEDEIDLQAYERAMAEYRENPVTYTHDEMRRILELD